jgi:hypothetical protein
MAMGRDGVGFHNVYDDLIAQGAPFLGMPTTPPFQPGMVLVAFSTGTEVAVRRMG